VIHPMKTDKAAPAIGGARALVMKSVVDLWI
jgi:hypothetical protein